MAFSNTDILQRVRASQSINNTYGEVTISTNLSIDRGYIWLIRRILFYWDTELEDAAQNAEEGYTFQITRESKAACLTTLNSADLIALHRYVCVRAATIGTDVGPMWWITQKPLIVEFPTPLAFAGNNLYFGVLSQIGTAVIYSTEIQFTLQKVKEGDYLRIASALLLT